MKKGAFILSLLALAVSLATAWAVSQQPKPRHRSNRDARRPRRPQ